LKKNSLQVFYLWMLSHERLALFHRLCSLADRRGHALSFRCYFWGTKTQVLERKSMSCLSWCDSKCLGSQRTLYTWGRRNVLFWESCFMHGMFRFLDDYIVVLVIQGTHHVYVSCVSVYHDTMWDWLTL
jgi:hypothetical protein